MPLAPLLRSFAAAACLMLPLPAWVRETDNAA